MLHIGVTWDWNPGQMIDIPVMTNCCEAELFLNGQSMGRKKVTHTDPHLCVPVWKLPFRDGEIRAVGYDEQGKVVCEDRRFTPGNTHELTLSCEDPFLLSDGWDLAFVTVSATDQHGHPVENARDRIKAAVTGGGRLIGTDNGDSTDPDSYKADCRRMFSGKILLIIASSGTEEDVNVQVCTTDGKKSSLTIPVRRVPLRNGISSRQEAFSRRLPGTVHARKICIEPEGCTTLNADHPECSFRYAVLPENADCFRIEWQVTNAAGIVSPYVQLTENGGTVTVRAQGDGEYYLRALCMEGEYCTFISQTGFTASGLGSPAIDPYSYVSAGLYDLHEGDIGTGNEKGIAFSRDGESMIGFSSVDFGKTGTDRITVDIFALNGDPYELGFTAVSADGSGETTAALRYQKPSIWNVYQAETWHLPKRLTGLQTLYFRMKDKIHMKGFVFEKQMNAFVRHPAGNADIIYGDCFRREGDSVTGIGNNVTLLWNDMDFGEAEETVLEIDGSTDLPVNTVSIRIRNDQGDEINSVAEFEGRKDGNRRFVLKVPGGNCTVAFVFLPGSSFDFHAFRFYRCV
jgi:beta-galactosidase